jgi:Protein of unknown function (DUF3866)
MLKLRRGVVVDTDPLTVRIGDQRRPAWADSGLVGEVEEGDEVVVNTEASDLGLGSGGFDVVHVNLTRGLEGSGPSGREHVMKLNYTSLQHSIDPVEVPETEDPASSPPASAVSTPVLVLPMHGHLAPSAWAAAQANLLVGYVQTAGGALPGLLSRDVAQLRQFGLLAGHVTAGAAYGGEQDAVTTLGALDAAARRLGWDAILCGPGPGILGSSTVYGHGGVVALESAHAALALGLPTLLSPRLSSSDPRSRHRGLSHHTEGVLRMLLGSVRVPVPEIELAGWPTGEEAGRADMPSVLDALHLVCDDRHDVEVQPVDLEGYAGSGLPIRTMGRTLAEDQLFFAAPLAAGRALATTAGVRA